MRVRFLNLAFIRRGSLDVSRVKEQWPGFEASWRKLTMF